MGLYRDNGKENGNYRDYGVYMVLYWENGKENGNYHQGGVQGHLPLKKMGSSSPPNLCVSLVMMTLEHKEANVSHKPLSLNLKVNSESQTLSSNLPTPETLKA